MCTLSVQGITSLLAACTNTDDGRDAESGRQQRANYLLAHGPILQARCYLHDYYQDSWHSWLGITAWARKQPAKRLFSTEDRCSRFRSYLLRMSIDYCLMTCSICEHTVLCMQFSTGYSYKLCSCAINRQITIKIINWSSI